MNSSMKNYIPALKYSSPNGIILGYGTSASPITTSVAGENFIEVRAKTNATSGDNRLGYYRYNINGAGASGECIRAFTDLTAAAGTARGAHISLQAGATGYITGLGAGIDAQLYIKNEALAANGTYAAVNGEIYAAGSSSTINAATQTSFVRLSIGGDATGAANIEDYANLISLTGGSNASGNIVGAVGNEPTWASHTYLVRCNFNGTTIYLVGVSL